MLKQYCRACGGLTDHDHWHDCAHGRISETHVMGSERFVCRQCELTTRAHDLGAHYFRFLFDGEQV